MGEGSVMAFYWLLFIPLIEFGALVIGGVLVLALTIQVFCIVGFHWLAVRRARRAR